MSFFGLNPSLVEKWLRANELYTNNFILDWVAKHPELHLALFKSNPSFSIPKPPSLPYEILNVASSKDSGVEIEATTSCIDKAAPNAFVSVVSSSCADYNPESLNVEPQTFDKAKPSALGSVASTSCADYNPESLNVEPQTFDKAEPSALGSVASSSCVDYNPESLNALGSVVSSSCSNYADPESLNAEPPMMFSFEDMRNIRLETLLDMAVAVMNNLTVPKCILQKTMHTAQLLFGCVSLMLLITDQNILKSQEPSPNVKVEFNRGYRLTSMDRWNSDSVPRQLNLTDVADILSLARDVIEDNCLFKLEEDSRTLLICLRGGEERTVGVMVLEYSKSEMEALSEIDLEYLKQFSALCGFALDSSRSVTNITQQTSILLPKIANMSPDSTPRMHCTNRILQSVSQSDLSEASFQSAISYNKDESLTERVGLGEPPSSNHNCTETDGMLGNKEQDKQVESKLNNDDNSESSSPLTTEGIHD